MTEEVHGRRLKFFRNRDFNVTEKLRDHLLYQQDELLVIERFEGIKQESGEISCEVKWRGFSSDENDWVSIDILREDVPVMIQDFKKELMSSGSPRERHLAALI